MSQVSMPSGTVTKDKDAQLDYTFDWSQWLAPDDSIASSAWTADAGITITAQTLDGNVATVFLSGGTPNQWYVVTNTVITASFPPRVDQRVLKVFVPADESAQPPMGTALFPNRFAAIAALRADQIVAAAAGALPSVELSDDYLWSKLLAAQAEIGRELRVYLEPTIIVPDDAPQAELDALEAAGQPWAQEGAYDYESSFFRGDKWGYMVTKSKPLIRVDSIRFIYPSALNELWEVPKNWIRLDKKYGHIRLVPDSNAFAAPLAAYVLQVIGGGQTIPFMIQLRYVAGLQNAATEWPDLVDVVKKKAVLSIIQDAFLPQSGSISADGLSQSMSVDMQKYADVIDLKLNGPKGSNGGLMTAIHGVRTSALGAV